MKDRASSCRAIAAHQVDVCRSLVADRCCGIRQLKLSRSTAYRLVQLARTEEKAGLAFVDDRHGHPYKLTEAVQAWLVDVCSKDPQISSSRIQAELKTGFGIEVSVGHINHVRAQHGVTKQRRGQAQTPVKKT